MALCPLTAGCSSLRSSMLSLPQCPRDACSFRPPLSPWCCGCATHLCGATVGSPGQWPGVIGHCAPHPHPPAESSEATEVQCGVVG